MVLNVMIVVVVSLLKKGQFGVDGVECSDGDSGVELVKKERFGVEFGDDGGELA